MDTISEVLNTSDDNISVVSGNPHSIVVADGNPWYCEHIKPIVTDLFPEIQWTIVSSAEDLIKHCRDHFVGMVIIDFSIDGMGLIDVVRILRKRQCTGRIVVTSFYEGSLYAEWALEAGADYCFDKSMLIDFLQKELSPCLEQ